MATGPQTTDIGPCDCCGGGDRPCTGMCVHTWDGFLSTWVLTTPCQDGIGSNGVHFSCICESPINPGTTHGQVSRAPCF